MSRVRSRSPRRPLRITANNQTITYGQPIPTLTASFSGLTRGDSPASLTVPPSISVPAAATDPGSYTISVAGAVDANYSIGYVAGTLTISPDGTTTTITPPLIETLAGQDVVFTATVKVGSTGLPVTAGSVQFQVDGQDLGSPVPIDANGKATLDPVLGAGAAHGERLPGRTTSWPAVNRRTMSSTSIKRRPRFPSRSQSRRTAIRSPSPRLLQPSTRATGLRPAACNSRSTASLPAPGSLDENGTASLSLSTVNGGTHTIAAVYLGEGSTFEGGDASTTLQVTPVSQTINFGPLASVTYGVAPLRLPPRPARACPSPTRSSPARPRSAART